MRRPEAIPAWGAPSKVCVDLPPQVLACLKKVLLVGLSLGP